MSGIPRYHLNFNYAGEQFDLLYGLARDSMAKHASLIVEEIRKLA